MSENEFLVRVTKEQLSVLKRYIVNDYLEEADGARDLWERLCNATLIRWEPTEWWRVTGPDGKLWCKTNSEQEAREFMRLDNTLCRLWTTQTDVFDWRQVEHASTVLDNLTTCPRKDCEAWDEHFHLLTSGRIYHCLKLPSSPHQESDYRTQCYAPRTDNG